MACFWWSQMWLSLGHTLPVHVNASTMPPASTHMPLQEGTWAEVARRLFALGAAAAHVRAGEGSGGLDPALGPNLGSSPLAALGPAVVLQFLAAGPASPDPRTSVAALPLVRPPRAQPCAQPRAGHVQDSGCKGLRKPVLGGQSRLRRACA